jgi:hypothetical protein
MPYSTKITLPDGFHDLGEKSSMESYKQEEMEDKVHYPSLYFSHAPEGLKNLPKEGTAIIHFKKVMERTEKVDRQGETSTNYCIELEIHGLKPSGDSETYETKEVEPDDEDAIEKGLEAASEENSNDDD